MIYLDHNATTPIAKEALEEMLPYLEEQYFNPSSAYLAAKKVRNAIELAREKTAFLFGCSSEEVIFTSGGTESINTALRSAYVTHPGTIVTSTIEHSATEAFLTQLEQQCQATVRRVPVDSKGNLREELWKDALIDARIISLIAANNETGTLQDIEKLTVDAFNQNLLVHLDAVQAFGKIDIKSWYAFSDFISVSGHKISGPKGIGALMIKKNRRFSPWLHGGSQEYKKRGGTENVASIVGFGKACELAAQRITNEDWMRVSRLRDLFEQSIVARLSGVKINGLGASRVPNTTNIHFDKCRSEGLLILLDERGVLASAGSACSSGQVQASRVLLAMGLSEIEAKSSIRFSLGPETTETEINHAVEEVIHCVEKLRSVQSQFAGPVIVYR